MTKHKTPEKLSPEKLSIVVFSGEFDKVHYALVMASCAAAIGKQATLFFTMTSCIALLKTSPSGEAPWRRMPLSKSGTIHDGDLGGDLDDDFRESGVANFEELLLSSVHLGVRFMVCEMGLKVMGINGGALREDIPMTPGGVATFINDASQNGAMLFI